MSNAHQPCPCAIHPVLDKTFERYPQRWYENLRLLLLITAGLATLLVYFQAQLNLLAAPSAWASILAISGWIMVWFADVISTGLIGDMKIEFDRRGLEPFGEERNPLLPRYPTWRDLVVNWTNAISLIICIFLWYVPVLVVIGIVFRWRNNSGELAQFAADETGSKAV